MKGVACSRALQPPALYYVGSYSSHIHKLHKSSSSSLSPVSPPSICLSLSFHQPQPPPFRTPFPTKFFSSFPSFFPSPLPPGSHYLLLCLTDATLPRDFFSRCHSSRHRTSDRWLSRRNSFPSKGIRLIAVIGKSCDIMRFFFRLYFVASLRHSHRREKLPRRMCSLYSFLSFSRILSRVSFLPPLVTHLLVSFSPSFSLLLPFSPFFFCFCPFLLFLLPLFRKGIFISLFRNEPGCSLTENSFLAMILCACRLHVRVYGAIGFVLYRMFYGLVFFPSFNRFHSVFVDSRNCQWVKRTLF